MVQEMYGFVCNAKGIYLFVHDEIMKIDHSITISWKTFSKTTADEKEDPSSFNSYV